MKHFLKEAQYELSQVTWLTKKQAIRISAITIVFVLVSAFSFWGVDLALTELYKLIQ